MIYCIYCENEDEQVHLKIKIVKEKKLKLFNSLNGAGNALVRSYFRRVRSAYMNSKSLPIYYCNKMHR